MRIAALLLAGFLAACAALPQPAARQASAGLLLAPGALRPAGSDLVIDFGRAKEGVLPAVTRLLGRPPDADAVNAECGAGPVNTVSWGDLDLTFQDGDLSGWISADPALATTTGLSAGLTRAELQARGIAGFTETSLGTEFQAGGIFGLLEGSGPDAEVTLLWSGVTCFFR